MKKMGVLFTIILMFALGITMTVKVSAAGKEQAGREKRLRMEEEYLEEVRQILLEKGCKNAGAVLTYITDTEGNLEYTLTVHHARMERMQVEELTLLKARMQETAKKILLTDIVFKQI